MAQGQKFGIILLTFKAQEELGICIQKINQQMGTNLLHFFVGMN